MTERCSILSDFFLSCFFQATLDNVVHVRGSDKTILLNVSDKHHEGTIKFYLVQLRQFDKSRFSRFAEAEWVSQNLIELVNGKVWPLSCCNEKHPCDSGQFYHGPQSINLYPAHASKRWLLQHCSASIIQCCLKREQNFNYSSARHHQLWTAAKRRDNLNLHQ